MRPTPTGRRSTVSARLTPLSRAPLGPPPFAQDPWPRVLSPRGIPVDQLVSVLQKAIRRSHVDDAVLAASDMHATSAAAAEHLWRRLRLMQVVHAVRYLALAPKDRTSSEHADYVRTAVDDATSCSPSPITPSACTPARAS